MTPPGLGRNPSPSPGAGVALVQGMTSPDSAPVTWEHLDTINYTSNDSTLSL